MAAGQAGMALHTMANLQAYQADVLKEMRRSMAGWVAAEHHLWLKLTEKEKVFPP